MNKLLSILALALFLSGCGADGGTKTADAARDFLKGSNKAAVIKFHAPWCATCKEYAPTFEKVKAELGGQVDFYSVDIDERQNKKLINQFRISRIPVTVFVSKDRANISKQMGPINYRELKTTVENLINL